jgi:hypothetical protein
MFSGLHTHASRLSDNNRRRNKRALSKTSYNPILSALDAGVNQKILLVAELFRMSEEGDTCDSVSEESGDSATAFSEL